MNQFLAVCLFALSSLLIVNEAGKIRVSVRLDDNMDETKGKFVVTLKGLMDSFNQQIEVPEHMTDLIKGRYYSSIVQSPYNMTFVNSTKVMFRKKTLGNWSGANKVKVHFVNIEELEANGTTILGKSQKFCRKYTPPCNGTTASHELEDNDAENFSFRCGQVIE